MKHINLFIIALATCLLQSCGLEESSSYMPGTKRVEFVARSTSYDKHHVSTKADADISAIEDNIYSAYFILFDNNNNKKGDLVDLTSSISSDKKTIDNKSITITPDDNTLSKARGCYLINVPKSYAESITKIDDLKTVDLDIEYAENSVSGMVGVPVLKNDTYPDGVMCLPMFGISSANPNFSKDNDNATFIMEIPLKRVFAKVQINYPTVNISGSSDAEFTAKNIIVNNIPKKVRLLNEDSNQTNWAVLTNDNKEHYLGENNLISYGSSNGSVKFYVPEHILKLNKTNDVQSNKPSLLEANHKAIYVSLSGTLTKSSTDIYDVKYKIYLGENPTNNFDLIRNKYYINSISITGTSENDARVEIYKQEEFTSLINNNESANCYIISSTGNYILPAYKGAFADITNINDSQICTGIADIVWEDSGTGNNVITLVKPNEVDNRIKFKISGNIVPGNALVAIKHPTSGEILWSWHLWFCKANDSPADQNYGGNNYLMDRFLGAKTPGSEGLSDLGLSGLYWKDGMFYQYGRKDPLNLSVTSGDEYDTDDLKGNLLLTHSKPYIFDKGWNNNVASWNEGSSKGKYDPCPPGYHVPSSGVWTKSEDDFSRLLNATELFFVYALLDPTIIYSYIGMLNSMGTYIDLEVGDGVTQDVYNSRIPIYSPTNQARLSSKPSRPPRKLNNIKYEEIDMNKTGSLVTDDKYVINYGFVDKGFRILSAQYQEGEWQERSSIFGGSYYTANYPSSTWHTITGEYKSDAEGNLVWDDNLHPNDRNEILDVIGFLSSFDFSGKIIFTKEAQTETQNGAYVVRCAKKITTN